MKKLICIFFILPALLLAPRFSKADEGDEGDPYVIEDVDDPNGMMSTVKLAWDANSEPDIAGYNVYYGRGSGNYTGQLTVTRPSATVSVRGNKVLYFAITAFTTSGIEGPFSNEVHWP